MKVEQLKKKSVDSFLLAIEIYNKPKIDYRLEGCIFFLCNAWELLLKARLIETEGIEKIYYNYGESNRTLSLNESISKVMTNDKDPVRINLNIIISLRNTATHFIVPEYEIAFLPFLTACVKNYADKLYAYCKIKISDYIKSDFLSIFVGNSIPKSVDIIETYGEKVAQKFSELHEKAYSYIEENTSENLAIRVNLYTSRVSNKNKANNTFYISKNLEDQNAKFITKHLDPNETHTYTFTQIHKEINNILEKEKIYFKPMNDENNKFTTYAFQLYIQHIKLKKENNDYCYRFELHGTKYKYSSLLITKFITDIQNDSELIYKLYQHNKKKRKKVR